MTTTPAELEFFAEHTLVTIIPKFSRSEPYEFIGGQYGPFIPNLPVKVPLWLALHLRKNQKCQVQAPSWMNPDRLLRCIENEKNGVKFTNLPRHFIEIAQLVMSHAGGDMPKDRAQRIKLLVEDISNIRQRKIRIGMKNIMKSASEGDPSLAIKMTNVATMEIMAIRPILLKSLGAFHEFRKEADEASASAVSAKTPSSSSSSRRRSFIQRASRASASSAAEAATPASTRTAATPVSGRASSSTGGASSTGRKRKIRRFR
eukprot:g4327.t1